MFSDYSTMLKRELDCPPLEDIQTALIKGLKNCFANVAVEVVDCPDLSVEPFNLACKGIGGSPSIVELGGVPYLLPTALTEKIYDMADMVKAIGIKPGFVIGAGAGPLSSVGKNSEMMANFCVDGEKIVNKTHIVKLKDDGSTKTVVSVLPSSETSCALLANLFVCEGTQSKVLKVHCKKRIGVENFITSIRIALQQGFQDKHIGLGGTFLIKSGKVLQHVMSSEFSSTPITTEKQLNEWLNFYEMSAPLVAVGTLMSSDIPELDLRVQHFHSFSDHGEAGHYHHDTTPNDAEYLAYFNVGKDIYRIDQPTITHQFGRV